MYPGFRRSWQRRFNAHRTAHVINAALGPRQPDERRVVITTLPITADLPNLLDVDRWVYYCVDDYAVWPGLAGSTLDRMEREQVSRMDRLIAVSEVLKDRLESLGGHPELMTHGIDPEHWSAAGVGASGWNPPEWWVGLAAPRIIFWGVVDRRLDTSWCLALAAWSDVLVMPYADLPVTRAIQPLKFKEYLATCRPVVARRLPAITGWADAADLVNTAEELVAVTNQRAGRPIPDSQLWAREHRLAGESWAAKAAAFERTIHDALRGSRGTATFGSCGDSSCGT
jgi:hypothetical protein